jgi:hypothetical protein
MDSLLNKPTYQYVCHNKSIINYDKYTNCCFISSFQIQMKKIYSDFPDLKELLPLLYPNTFNAFTEFAYDFPEKWQKLKKYLINKDTKWIPRLNIYLQICLPLKENNKCVLLTFIDINKVNPEEVNKCNYKSLMESFSDSIISDKIIRIIQFPNHFEPFEII